MELCEGLLKAARSQDRSAPLLETLTTSLLHSFSPSEAISTATKKSCAKALLLVSSISKEGYLQDVPKMTQSISELISLFTVVGTNFLDRGEHSNTTSVYPVTEAVRLPNGSATYSFCVITDSD